MTHENVFVVSIAAAVTVALLYKVLLSRSGNQDDAVRDLKLFANIGLIVFLWAILIAAAALVAYAYWTKKWDFVIVAIAVATIGLKLFGDLSFRHRRPLSDFFSLTPGSDRVGRLYSETADLLRQRSGIAPEEKPRSPFAFTINKAEREPGTVDPSRLPPELLAQLPPEVAAGLTPENVKSKTYTVSFSFGRHKKAPR